MYKPLRKKSTANHQLKTDKPQDIKRSLKLFIGLLLRSKTKMTIVIFAALVGSVFYTLIPWIMGVSIDNVATLITQYGLGNFSVKDVINSIKVPLIILVILSILSFVSSFVQERIMAEVSELSGTYLREMLTHKMTRLPLKFYDDIKVGEILSRNSVDIERISEILVVGFNQLLSSSFNIFIGIGLMIWISARLTLIVFILIMISSLVTLKISRMSQDAFSENFSTLGSFNSLIEELFTGNTLIKIYNQQDTVINRVTDSNEAQHRAHLKAMFMNYAIYPAIRFLNQIAFIVSAVYGGFLAINGLMTLGVIQAYLQYVSQVSEPITEASFIINSFQASLASIERVYEILDQSEETEDQSTLTTLDYPKGKIEFRDVVFSYDKKNPVMKGVSFIAKPENMIAIVGPTGAGKTTLINLLMRFYEIDSGQILIDDIDIRDMSRKDVRKMFGMVLQDTWLFEGSVIDNLSYGNRQSKFPDVKEAARLAQADQFIETMSKGYDTIISSDASVVSQGQQQLLTIARTALVSPPILILDEATSNIDTITEIKIQKALTTLMKGRTSFVIAHRLSTIRNADIILVMNEGNVIESGNHEQLINRNGLYSELYQSQFITQ